MSSRTLTLLEAVGEGWSKLACPVAELRLDIVLSCGQSFRWRSISPGVWASVLDDNVWILSQNESEILYKVYPSSSSATDSKTVEAAASAEEMLKHEAKLRDYFQLDSCRLSDLFARWRRVDPHFDACCDRFHGVRTLRQHPVENLFAFICSSNNNIARISSMVENLCIHFGEDCGITIEGEKEERFFTFPRVERLTAPNVEDKLRKLGFGYRAKFVTSSAQSIVDNGGEDWLLSLRTKSHRDAKAELMKLCGVGAKVADCACLMSLDKNGAVPVDTHVLQIAQKYLNAGITVPRDCSGPPDAAIPSGGRERSKGKRKSIEDDLAVDAVHDRDAVDLEALMTSTKTLTPRVYDAIGDYFRSIWGADFAGWAQGVVFAADLKSFSIDEAKKTTSKTTKTKKKAGGDAIVKKKKKRSC